jgi:soluble cytochrome b562
MSGIYTELAKRRVEQSKEPVSHGSPPPLPEKPRLHGAQKKEKQQNGTPQADPHLVVKTRPVKPRHGFDIYVDQYEQLVKWANEEKLQGGTGSMSRMAREALDMYIASRKKK